MANFIDRRLNPKDRSLGNRRRFVRRVRTHVKESVDRSIRGRGVAEADRKGRVTVPADGIREPTFHLARTGGHREAVLTGNKSFRVGDRIPRPPAGAGGSGRSGSPDGEGTDDFAFVLSREEFLDIFFEDLELPDLAKRSLKEIASTKRHRAGYSVSGSPPNLNVRRTMRNALGRRLALRRPNEREVYELREEIFALEAIQDPDPDERERLADFRESLEALLNRRKRVPYIDPLDVRFNFFETRPEPNTSAVMFCLMDVSASMGEREKDLAKRFFVLLHLFLGRRYEKVDLVFIRHTQQASEVDEETFFNARETGGTVVSTALVEMRRVIQERYPPSEWNIYAAQASDGENLAGDSLDCAHILSEELMKVCQYFAYVEILTDEEASFVKDEASGTELWRCYRTVAETWGNFAMKRIARPSDIYPVFRELFARHPMEACGG